LSITDTNDAQRRLVRCAVSGAPIDARAAAEIRRALACDLLFFVTAAGVDQKDKKV